ncbi:MAG TPA: hypothetical protein VF469_10895, partial [Kofleriaceae bacterium]
MTLRQGLTSGTATSADSRTTGPRSGSASRSSCLSQLGELPYPSSASCPPHRVEVAGELQLEVVGADHCHRPPRSPSSAWGTSSTSAAVERQDREHGARELHGRDSAGERGGSPGRCRFVWANRRRPRRAGDPVRFELLGRAMVPRCWATSP